MRNPLNIAIIGAGFAGLSSAILLAQQGHIIHLFDKFLSPLNHGAGILMQPTGLWALEKLGLAEQVLLKGQKITQLLGTTTKTGSWFTKAPPKEIVVMDIRYTEPGRFGLGVHRGVLFNALWQKANQIPAQNLEIFTNQNIQDIEVFKSKYDLVIIANGTHSNLRHQMKIPYTDREYPWGAFWIILSDPLQHFQQTLRQWYHKADQMLGLMPTGYALENSIPQISLFWSTPLNQAKQVQDNGLQAFKLQIDKLTKNSLQTPIIESLLQQITDIDQLTLAEYRDVIMPYYHKDNVVIIGDAAHGMSPQLGQGTNMALIDSIVLASAIKTKTSLDDALNEYSRTRQPHLRFYSQASRLLTPLFQSHINWAPWIRDHSFLTASKLPFIRTAIYETLSGVRQDWLGLKPRLQITETDCASSHSQTEPTH